MSDAIQDLNLPISLDHVAVAVEDLEKAIQWYMLNLGFQLLERRLTEGASTSMISAVLKSGNAVVVLVQGTSKESQVSQFIAQFGAGIQHMALRVTNLDIAIKRIAAGSAAAETEVIEGEGIRQVFLRRDPGSGVRIELIERTSGNFTDSSVTKLFRAFETRGLY